MPDYNKLLGSAADWTVVATVANNTACVATKAAPGANKRHFITGITISCSAAPSATVAAHLDTASTVLDQFEIPASAFSPIVEGYTRPLTGGVNEVITLTIPAVGGTTRATAVLKGFTTHE